MWLAGSQLIRRSRKIRQVQVTALRRLAPPQRFPHRLHHRRHPLRLVENHLHPHLPQLHRRLRRHPPRHHHHLGVQPPPRLEQPLDHLRRVQIRQTVVEHDQRRLHPTDLEQRIHPRRRLHHLQIQIRPLDRQHQRLQVARIVVHHHHHVVAVRPLELRGHRHLVRVQKRREILRLHTPPPRRGLVPLQQPLVDPVRYRRGRDLTDARHALRAPVSLVLWQTHRTPNKAKMGSAQGGLWNACNSRWALLFKRLNYNTLEGVSLPLSATAYRRASVHLLVASNTASTALRSVLSLISHVPVSSCASRPPSPCTATSTNLRSNASMIVAPSSAMELSASSRSEEHTSELQSPYDLVCRLLLEKKKKKHERDKAIVKMTRHKA